MSRGVPILRAGYPRSAISGALLAVLIASAGCTQSDPADRVSLRLHHLKIQGHALQVEIAADATKREVGLGYRPSMPEDGGMLFIFPQVQPQSFWMKHCLIDLDIAYIDEEGKIVDVLRMKTVPAAERNQPKQRYPSSRPVRYVLETNAGWFESKGIGPGALVEGYRGPNDLRVQ
jgi:uncharacterized membrane protein (UPF0127 family)